MKKRLLVFLLSLSLCLSLGVSVNAASTQNSLDGKDFSDAYISFSEQLAEKGVSAQTCLEDFISGYESFDGSIEQYISTLVEYETRQAPSLNTTVRRNLQIASEYFAAHSEAPSAEYSTRSTRGQWYDNIGETNPKLPQAADYSSYNILTKVKKGDIIHETSGGIATIVGHIAVVEGKYGLDRGETLALFVAMQNQDLQHKPRSGLQFRRKCPLHILKLCHIPILPIMSYCYRRFSPAIYFSTSGR